ncbi:MAG TPA: hypothetical protein ENJ66_01230 [Calditrichae bacterium]|nr:hypothetical protein [Calditrichia bacterium]
MAYSSRKKSSSRRRKQRAPRLKLRWVLGIVVVFIGFVFFSGPKSLIKLYVLLEKKDQLVRSREELKQRVVELDTEIHRLKTDTTYIEKMAREKYLLKRADEEVVMIKTK